MQKEEYTHVTKSQTCSICQSQKSFSDMYETQLAYTNSLGTYVVSPPPILEAKRNQQKEGGVISSEYSSSSKGQ